MNRFTLVGAWESAIARARKGHKAEGRAIAGEIARLIRNGEPIPEIAQNYLALGLQQIADGERADVALCTSGKPGVSDPPEQFATPANIGALIAHRHLQEGTAKSLHAASLLAEEEINFSVDSKTIRNAFNRLKLEAK